MRIKAIYELHLSATTGNYHYEAWLVADGRNVDSRTGCSIAPHWLDLNRRGCEREARRACRKMLRRHLRAARAGEPGPVVYFEGEEPFDPLGGAARGVGRCTCPAGPGTNPGCPVHP